MTTNFDLLNEVLNEGECVNMDNNNYYNATINNEIEMVTIDPEFETMINGLLNDGTTTARDQYYSDEVMEAVDRATEEINELKAQLAESSTYAKGELNSLMAYADDYRVKDVCNMYRQVVAYASGVFNGSSNVAQAISNYYELANMATELLLQIEEEIGEDMVEEKSLTVDSVSVTPIAIATDTPAIEGVSLVSDVPNVGDDVPCTEPIVVTHTNDVITSTHDECRDTSMHEDVSSYYADLASAIEKLVSTGFIGARQTVSTLIKKIHSGSDLKE